ncbi:MAG: hypothetical protein JRJ60_03890 [Deltaproteobacteria bacterium]|nr:hypothetical protein [Deltaproteobacteria bacterium]
MPTEYGKSTENASQFSIFNRQKIYLAKVAKAAKKNIFKKGFALLAFLAILARGKMRGQKNF